MKVHDDKKSHDLADELNAKAFTTGKDIFLAENEYKPHTKEGKELIGHELTHVVQQENNKVIQRQKKIEDPDVQKQLRSLTKDKSKLGHLFYLDAVDGSKRFYIDLDRHTVQKKDIKGYVPAFPTTKEFYDMWRKESFVDRTYKGSFAQYRKEWKEKHFNAGIAMSANRKHFWTRIGGAITFVAGAAGALALLGAFAATGPLVTALVGIGVAVIIPLGLVLLELIVSKLSLEENALNWERAAKSEEYMFAEFDNNSNRGKMYYVKHNKVVRVMNYMLKNNNYYYLDDTFYDYRKNKTLRIKRNYIKGEESEEKRFRNTKKNKWDIE